MWCIRASICRKPFTKRCGKARKERCKIHDLVMQGIEMALKKRGYPSIDDLKAGKKR